MFYLSGQKMWRNFLWPIGSLRKQWQGWVEGQGRESQSPCTSPRPRPPSDPECYHLPVRSLRANRLSPRVTGCAHVPHLPHLHLASESSPWHSWLQVRTVPGFLRGSLVSTHRRSDDCRLVTVPGSGFLWCSLVSTPRHSDDLVLSSGWEPFSAWVSLGPLVSKHRKCVSGRSVTEMMLCVPQTGAQSLGLYSLWSCDISQTSPLPGHSLPFCNE